MFILSLPGIKDNLIKDKRSTIFWYSCYLLIILILQGKLFTLNSLLCLLISPLIIGFLLGLSALLFLQLGYFIVMHKQDLITDTCIKNMLNLSYFCNNLLSLGIAYFISRFINP